MPASMAATSSRESGLPRSTPDTSPTNTGWICRIETVIDPSLSQARPERARSASRSTRLNPRPPQVSSSTRVSRIRTAVPIPTEPIGSLPRPIELVDALSRKDSEDPSLVPRYEAAIRDTLTRFEATGSPVVTDGEQRKYHNFLTYPVHGLPNMNPDGFQIPFAAGHIRRMPRLTHGPFRYRRYADEFLPSALSLMYPPDGISDYSREQFIRDLLNEHEIEVRRCVLAGAAAVQIDFTEGRLAMKVDPSGHLLTSFIDLNNLALDRFS